MSPVERGRGEGLRWSRPWRRWRCTRSLGHDWTGWRYHGAHHLEYRDCGRCGVRELTYPAIRRQNDKRWFVRRTLTGRLRETFA